MVRLLDSCPLRFFALSRRLLSGFCFLAPSVFLLGLLCPFGNFCCIFWVQFQRCLFCSANLCGVEPIWASFLVSILVFRRWLCDVLRPSLFFGKICLVYWTELCSVGTLFWFVAIAVSCGLCFDQFWCTRRASLFVGGLCALSWCFRHLDFLISVLDFDLHSMSQYFIPVILFYYYFFLSQLLSIYDGLCTCTCVCQIYGQELRYLGISLSAS